jgi:hypothetical protein
LTSVRLFGLSDRFKITFSGPTIYRLLFPLVPQGDGAVPALPLLARKRQILIWAGDPHRPYCAESVQRIAEVTCSNSKLLA